MTLTTRGKRLTIAIVAIYIGFFAYLGLTNPSTFATRPIEAIPSWYLLVIAFLAGMLTTAILMIVVVKLMIRRKAKANAKTAAVLGP
jgi:TRAP-type C4-dicarboxylate transport system permease small subunit